MARCAALFGFVLFLGGCSSEPAQPPLYPLTVTVVQNGKAVTVGGLIFMLAGHVPVRGEVVTDDSGVQFEVVDADARRIKRVRLRLPGTAPGGTIA